MPEKDIVRPYGLYMKRSTRDRGKRGAVPPLMHARTALGGREERRIRSEEREELTNDARLL